MKKKPSKRKTVWMEKVLPPHPATTAAESDLVKLTKEHEAVKQHIADAEAQLKEIYATNDKAHEEYYSAASQRGKLVESINRSIRTFRTQLENVDELIRNAIGR